MLEQIFLESTQAVTDSLSVALTEITKQAVVLGDFPLQASNTPSTLGYTVGFTITIITPHLPH